MSDPLLSLKLNQLRLIAAIAETRQLQVAAEAMALSQPAASRMLAEIERIVGTPLFERHPKGMTPTPVGRVLSRRAAGLGLELQGMAREVRLMLEGRGGLVRVGAVTGAAVGYLVPAIQQLKAAAPDVEVTVEVAPSVTLLRGLSAGNFDFILARPMPESERGEYEIAPARHETVSLLVRRDHPLASAPALNLDELSEYQWVIQERGAPIRHAVEDAFAAVGHSGPRNVINTSSLLLMIAFLAQTNAIAPMSEEVAQLLIRPPVSAALAALRLRSGIEVSPYFLLSARGRGLSPLAQRLRVLVMEELGAARASR